MVGVREGEFDIPARSLAALGEPHNDLTSTTPFIADENMQLHSSWVYNVPWSLYCRLSQAS